MIPPIETSEDYQAVLGEIEELLDDEDASERWVMERFDRLTALLDEYELLQNRVNLYDWYERTHYWDGSTPYTWERKNEAIYRNQPGP